MLDSTDSVTVGKVNGVSYIFYANIGCFTYNEGTNSLDNVVLTGLTIGDIIGITGSSGYLIAYTTTALAWSSTITPTDFVPSSVTGAGGGNVSGIEGDIIFVLANPLGVLIYTETNAVAGTFTGNFQYPFKFREIDDSKGGISLDFAAYEANSAKQFVYSKAGLQSVDSRLAVNILPMVTDFLAGKVFEDYDELTDSFSQTQLSTTMLKKIKFIASRYLVISYGITEFTHALVYDLTLQRLGKIKLTHTDCFEYTGTQLEVSKESLAFLFNTGEVHLVDFSDKSNSSGVLMLGKLQYSLGRRIVLHEGTLEHVKSTASFSCSIKLTSDGKTLTSVEGYLADSADGVRKYNYTTEGLQQILHLAGKFELNTAFIRYSVGGRR